MAEQMAAAADRPDHRADIADFLFPANRRGARAAHAIVAALDAHDPKMSGEHVAEAAIGFGIAAAAMDDDERLAASRLGIDDIETVGFRGDMMCLPCASAGRRRTGRRGTSTRAPGASGGRAAASENRPSIDRRDRSLVIMSINFLSPFRLWFAGP